MHVLASLAPWLLRLQAVGLCGLGVFVAIRAFGNDVHSVGLTIALAVITFGAGLLLGYGAHAIPRGIQWPQAPAIFLQVCGILSGAMMVKGSLAAVGIPLILFSLVTMVGVVSIRSIGHPDR
jgi:hypothetical protein